MIHERCAARRTQGTSWSHPEPAVRSPLAGAFPTRHGAPDRAVLRALRAGIR